MNFKTTLDVHLQAITDKDLATFQSTLHQQVAVILPNGKLITDLPAVVEFHQNWFADPDWKLRYEIVRVQETAEMGLALLYVWYDDLDPTGTPYQKQYYLQLLFVKEGERWLLLQDQNTFTN